MSLRLKQRKNWGGREICIITKQSRSQVWSCWYLVMIRNCCLGVGAVVTLVTRCNQLVLSFLDSCNVTADRTAQSKRYRYTEAQDGGRDAKLSPWTAAGPGEEPGLCSMAAPVKHPQVFVPTPLNLEVGYGRLDITGLHGCSAPKSTALSQHLLGWS
jgi:hypothetical protein